MIKHVVMLKFHEEADGRSKEDNLRLASEILNELPGKIEYIRTFSVGINQLQSDRSYDLCIVADFESWDRLNDYANHPEHLAALEFIKKVREASHSCDYEF